MKIALLGSRGIPASYSGFETFYEQLALRLVQRGHEVTVYCRSHHVKYPGKEYRGIRLIHLPSIATKHLDTLSHTFLSLLHALFCNYDIHYVCIVGNSPLCLLLKLFGKKVILNVDGADADRQKWKGLAKAYIRWSERVACRVADVIIADSRVIARRYLECFGRETEFIPYGTNLLPRAKEAQGTDLLERLGLKADQYILFVSRLTPENCAHLLIDAFLKARTELKLVIVGDAPYVDQYKEQLRSLCGESVIMTGYLFGDDYRRISSNCRFFVLPSGIDGTRPVLLDQMGFGNCVVVRNTPANMEVIDRCGLCFDHGNPVDSLAETIELLSWDYDTVLAYRQRALERAEAHFSWERVTTQYEELFGRLQPGAAGGSVTASSVSSSPVPPGGQDHAQDYD